MLFSSKRHLSGALPVLMSLCVLNCGGNQLSDFPDTDSNEYRLSSAKRDMDNYRFSDAIRKLKPVVGRSPTNQTAVLYLSEAYAGRAGLRIIDLLDEISAGSDDKGILLIFAEHFTKIDDNDVLDMQKAVEYFETLGTEANIRTSEQNFYAIFLYYGLVGISLNLSALDPEDNSLRANFKACHTVVDFDAVKTGLTNSEADTVKISLAKALDTISEISLGSDLDVLGDITNQFPGGLTADPVCVATPNDPICIAVRNVINVGKSDNGMGLGTGETPCAVVTP